MKTKTNRQMKLNFRFCLILFLMCNFSFGQLWYYKNKDTTHWTVMTEIITYLGIQNAENIKMEVELNKAVSKLRDELDINYGTSPYDQNSSFITGSVLRAANAAMGTMLTMSGYTAYFPQTKRDYISGISTNSLNLLWLQYMNPNVVRNADRQHVYRIRREIIRSYSGDERSGRSILLIMALFYAGFNDQAVINTLKALEIVE